MNTKKLQGFATMSVERRKSIASLGGKAAHASGKAYRLTSKMAKKIGKKGGIQSGINRAQINKYE